MCPNKHTAAQQRPRDLLLPNVYGHLSNSELTKKVTE